MIGQNKEKNVLKEILRYFKREDIKISENKTTKEEVIYYKIYVGGKEFRERLFKHFEMYPLLGDKKDKYEVFKEGLEKNKEMKENLIKKWNKKKNNY